MRRTHSNQTVTEVFNDKTYQVRKRLPLETLRLQRLVTTLSKSHKPYLRREPI